MAICLRKTSFRRRRPTLQFVYNASALRKARRRRRRPIAPVAKPVPAVAAAAPKSSAHVQPNNVRRLISPPPRTAALPPVPRFRTYTFRAPTQTTQQCQSPSWPRCASRTRASRRRQPAVGHLAGAEESAHAPVAAQVVESRRRPATATHDVEREPHGCCGGGTGEYYSWLDESSDDESGSDPGWERRNEVGDLGWGWGSARTISP
ncbi:hypothetical protein B0H17DRAFT_300423 [Mycena rosella]|uniref:Uncharacterized protein n=1 Tax=Mycena rosella TaxID=1033263 RepID=A0AAD7CUS3_MYCRO|nr:hypothetical protein B0H17DRAFT_300423 [Mycena rosella]